jgi:hypothetical protein
MSTTNELTEVLEKVRAWPLPMQISLARRILETVDASQPAAGEPRGKSAAEVMATLKTDKPAPDDAAVQEWIDEHRTQKYGR